MFECRQTNFRLNIGSVECGVFALRHFSTFDALPIVVEFFVLFVFLGDARNNNTGLKPMNCYVEKYA